LGGGWGLKKNFLAKTLGQKHLFLKFIQQSKKGVLRMSSDIKGKSEKPVQKNCKDTEYNSIVNVSSLYDKTKLVEDEKV
jgi:hypothetical protein